MMLKMSHVGVCVSDFDRAKLFYSEVCGFVPAAAISAGQECAALVGVNGAVKFDCQFMIKDATLIELIRFTAPLPVGPSEPRPMHQIGLTHLSFRVDDLEAVARSVVTHGGTIMQNTRTTYPIAPGLSVDILFCTDPDGTRIELMQAPDDVRFDVAS